MKIFEKLEDRRGWGFGCGWRNTASVSTRPCTVPRYSSLGLIDRELVAGMEGFSNSNGWRNTA